MNLRGNGVTEVPFPAGQALRKETFRQVRARNHNSPYWFQPHSTTLSYIALLLLLVIVCYYGYESYQSAQSRRRSDGELNQRISRLEEKISQKAEQLEALSKNNREILSDLSLPAKVWGDFNRGVCMIHGSYQFIDRETGRPVEGAGIDPDSEVDLRRQFATRTDSKSAEVSFEGTGFHVGEGYILTNRHMVEPWRYSLWPQLLSILKGTRPRLEKLEAFFPGRLRPFTLKVVLISQSDDLAICKLERVEGPTEIPVLPLDREAKPVGVGDRVMMLGYPHGGDRLLAALRTGERQALFNRYGEGSSAVISWLARRELIKPLLAQGHVLDMYVERIVYDGASGEGNSGAPIFGPSGRVVGISYGQFVQNESLNYAVPVERAISLLEKAGRKDMK